MADTGVVSSRLWRYPRAMDMPSVLKRRAQRIRQLEAANAQLLARIRHLEAQLAKAGADPWEQIIGDWLRTHQGWRHTTAALLHAVGVRQADKEAELRVRDIMLKLGWHKGLVPTTAGRIRGYLKRHALTTADKTIRL